MCGSEANPSPDIAKVAAQGKADLPAADFGPGCGMLVTNALLRAGRTYACLAASVVCKLVDLDP